MGEHRRRAQRTQYAPEVQRPAAQLQDDAAPNTQPHVVHRRRIQASQTVLQENGEAPIPDQKEAAAPEPVEMFAQPQTAAAPETAARKKRTVSAPAKKKHLRTFKKADGRKQTQKLKKAAGEWALTAAMLLGAAAQALALGARKVRDLAVKAALCLRGKRLPLRGIAMVLLACVALVSAYQIGAIMLRSFRTNRLNDDLARQRAALMEEGDTASQAEVSALEALEEADFVPGPFGTPVPAANMKTPEEIAQEIEQEIERASAQRREIEPAPAATQAPDAVKSMKYHQVGGEALPEMASLREKNNDLVAWIQIPDVLDLPIVYRDNDYYLTHDFNKKKNTSGTLFLDVNHPFKEKTQNLLLHGHNMKDGTMFGRLAQYLYDDTYLRNHPFIYFDTLWKKEQYVIFAVLDVSLSPQDKRFFNYFTHDTFSSDAEFKSYVRQLQIRSAYAIPIDVEPSDALLTLSTCLDDDRLVIVCRRLREDETRSQLRELIRMSSRQ